MRTYILIFSLALSAAGRPVADSTPARGVALAVAELAAEGIPVSDARLIADRLRTELVSAGVTVLERAMMEDILKEQGLAQSGVCSEATCAVEIGKLLGVNRIVAGTVGKAGNTMTINVRVIDVTTGQLVSRVTTDCRCTMDELLATVAPETAGRLAAGISGTKYVPSKASIRHRNRILRRIGFGIAAAGLGAGGFILDRRIAAKMEDNRAIADRYAAAATNANYPAESDAYKKNWDDAKKITPLRNALYGAAAACGVGFVISIPF